MSPVAHSFEAWDRLCGANLNNGSYGSIVLRRFAADKPNKCVKARLQFRGPDEATVDREHFCLLIELNPQALLTFKDDLLR